MRHALAFLVMALGMLMIPLSAGAVPLPVTPYLCFDSTQTSTLQNPFTGSCGTANSPFAAAVNAGSFSGAGGYFYLETFEDKLFNTPGVSASAGSIDGPDGPVVSTIVDSVDADDGAIDGSGLQGHALFASGNPGITFSFSAGILGALPTHVGIVWTDGANFNEVTAFAYDSASNLIGSIVAGSIGDGNFVGGTSEDRFFGFIDAGGIASLRIFNSVMSGGGSGIEVDHLQYGRTGSAIPEPASLALLGIALAGLGFSRRRKLR